ncbi:MAG: hypothetical protein A3E78_05205 [Alphaproteobacteria bacterium RIFCSPHIGHO2_12_FULL_63_12]|nr:MAG: hypothetical protein A3E78_05205 [Alphaproteobacteria bacterium RIFCSPHIGHO2_12_FULL_63_12]
MLIAVIVAGLIFYEAFVALKSLANVRAMQETVRGSLAVVQSTSMSDDEKAAAMQQSSVAMIGSVGVIFAKILVAVAASALFLYLVSLVAWPFNELVEYSIRPLPLLAVIVILSIYGMVRHGRRK